MHSFTISISKQSLHAASSLKTDEWNDDRRNMQFSTFATQHPLVGAGLARTIDPVEMDKIRARSAIG